jgi:opacity protein-like surface antigen
VNKSFSKNPIILLGLAAISTVSGALVARAESSEPMLVSAVESANSAPVHTETAIAVRPQPPASIVAPTFVSVPSPTSQSAIDRQLLDAAATFSPNTALLAQTQPSTVLSPLPTETTTAPTDSAIPIPGALATSVEALQGSFEATAQELGQIDTVQLPVAQRRAPSRARFNPGDSYSYIGIGGNIGITENDDNNTTTTNNDNERESSIGKGSFAINAKLGLGPSLSLRPSILVSDDLAFLIPLTYDFRIPTRDVAGVSPFIPFAGAGVAITTTGNNHFGFLLTGGVDYRISPQWTANGSLNVGFLSNSTDIGLILGIGYTFPGLGFSF